jgi:hypothetical protein
MSSTEPWLRGTDSDVPAVARAVLHALQLAEEDLVRWCGGLLDEEMNARPSGVAPVAFHVRHVARSIDRLLTYAEARTLSERQLALLRTELDVGAKREELFAELNMAFSDAIARLGQDESGGDEDSREEATTNHSGRAAGAHCRSHAAACRAGDHNGEGRSRDALTTRFLNPTKA